MAKSQALLHIARHKPEFQRDHGAYLERGYEMGGIMVSQGESGTETTQEEISEEDIGSAYTGVGL